MSNILSPNAVAGVAALIGDPARANMVSALMGGMALTAGELARHARVTAQTASGHLARMADSALVVVERQGRHRYYRLASVEVAQAVEALSLLAMTAPGRRHRVGPRDAALRRARTCYDHIAGRLGLALADTLAARGHLVLEDGAGQVSGEGRAFLIDFGIAFETGSARPLCRTCLDWSERRHHLSGRLGAALMTRLLDLHWIARVPGGRVLDITPLGERGLAETFGIGPEQLAERS